MRILALVPGGISDQLLFFPTLEDLQRQYPQAIIDVLVEPRAKNAYRVCQWVNDVLPFDYKDRNSLADYLNLLGIVRDREYDVALSLGERWTVDLLLWLNGIPKRIGYANSTSWLLSDAISLKTEQYAGYKYHDLLQGLDIHTPCPSLSINVPKPDIEWAEAEQKRLGIDESGYIIIHEGSHHTEQSESVEKVYPVQKWQTIIQDIQQRQADLPIVLLQKAEDSEWVAMMMQSCSNLANLKVSMPADLGKLAAMIAGGNLMLCTDSAPMHLSIAVGTYTIVLFGSTEASKKLPPNSDNIVGIQSPTRWIADITPESILEAIWRE